MPASSPASPGPARPKPAAKRAYHHGDLKAALLKAALKLIARHGPGGFSLSEAARLAGVSVGAPYRHFPDKESLLAKLAAEGFHHLLARLELAAASTPHNPRKRVAAIGAAYVRFAVDHPSHFQIMFDSALHRRNHSDLDAPASRCFQLLARSVRQAAATRNPRGLETRIAAAYSLMHGHAIFALDGSFHHMGFKTDAGALLDGSLRLLMDAPAPAATLTAPASLSRPPAAPAPRSHRPDSRSTSPANSPRR